MTVIAQLVIRAYSSCVPRAFTSEESEAIRSRLKAAAAEAFAQRGLRRTTVEDLARAAAISKGAFYGFYPSKEALLLALLEDYEQAVQEDVESAVVAAPASALDVVVDTAVNALATYPFLAVLMSQESLRVLQAATDEQRAALLERDVRFTGRIVALLGEAGLVVQVPEGALLGLLRSLVFVGLHRQEIGPDVIEEMATWLKQALRGCVRPADDSAASR